MSALRDLVRKVGLRSRGCHPGLFKSRPSRPTLSLPRLFGRRPARCVQEDRLKAWALCLRPCGSLLQAASLNPGYSWLASDAASGLSRYPLMDGGASPGQLTGAPMAELKTKQTEQSVDEYINAIVDDTRRQDCRTLIELMSKATGAEPKMWGTSMVGFGKYHYKYESGHEGDAMLTGFVLVVIFSKDNHARAHHFEIG